MGQFANPEVTTDDVEEIMTVAENTVVARFDQVSAYADNAMKTAMEMLGELEKAAEDFDFTVPSIGGFFPAPISLNFNIGDPPVRPDINMALPQFPEAPILAAIGLMTNIESYLQAVLTNGAPAVNPAVEMQIWQRGQERDQLARDAARANLAAEWAKRGFDLPDGILVATLTQEEVDYRNKRLDLSRDISIKQYETAFENTKFIIGSILKMEEAIIQAVSEGNKSLVAQYGAEVDGFKAQVTAAVETVKAFVDRYKGEGEVYKAKAQAQAAIAEVDVKMAEAMINVAIAQLQLYLKQAELKMTGAEVEAKLRVSAAEAGGRIAAALASGAFSGISVQAHLSASGSTQKNYTGSEQLSETHYFTEK
jgi:hypothetical protein